jgi:hypothetical protein
MLTMLKRIMVLILLAGGAFFLHQCSTDVDLYADYKMITIVYGILDQEDDTAWIKVTRAFSGPGNALDFAQNPDSSNFPYKLDVRLTGRKNGVDLPELVFDTMTIRNKKAGDSIFYFPNQLMYYSPAQLDEDATYHLVINNQDIEITSETDLIPNFSITAPRNFIDFTTNNKTIDWISARYGKRYEVSYVFHYKELRPGNPDTLDKQMSWFVGTRFSADTDGGEDMFKSYAGDAFYAKLESDLEDVPNVQRWAGVVDFYVSAGSQTLQNYLSINEATGTLLTEVPAYTNIVNGTGILAARSTTIKSARLSTRSLEMLVDDYDLGFRYPIE